MMSDEWKMITLQARLDVAAAEIERLQLKLDALQKIGNDLITEMEESAQFDGYAQIAAERSDGWKLFVAALKGGPNG
jgi:hypothetical protein